MDEYFSQFSKCIERAALQLAAQPGSHSRYKGRGTINIHKAKEAPRASYCNDMEVMVTPLNREGSRLLMQSRRVASIRDNAQSPENAWTLGKTCKSATPFVRT